MHPTSEVSSVSRGSCLVTSALRGRHLTCATPAGARRTRRTRSAGFGSRFSLSLVCDRRKGHTTAG